MGALMNLNPVHHVALSTPIFHALNLVASADRVSPDRIVERVVCAYLEARLGAIHEAHHQQTQRSGAQVIDLSARRAAQGVTRRSRNTGSRKRSSINSE